MLIQSAQQVDEHLPVGVVLDHADLLADDPPLLLHALLGEIGDGDEGEQGPKILLKMFCGLKIVAGDGVAGEGVGRGPVGRQLLKGVALLGVEHLVLQIVGHSGRGIVPGPVQLKAQVHSAIIGGKEGVLLLKLRLGKDEHIQPVVQDLVEHLLPDPLKSDLLHGLSPPVHSENTRCPVPAFGPRPPHAPG